MLPAAKHYYGLTLIEGDDIANGVRIRSLHPFQPYSVGDEFGPDNNFARGRRLVVARVVHFISTDGEEVVDDVRVYYNEAGPHLRSV